MELAAISSMTVRRALYRTEPYYLGELTDLHSSIRQIFPLNETYEQIKSRAVTFMDTVETKLDHLENIYIQNTFPTRRNKKTKIQSGELGNDSATNFSPEKKFKVDVFQRISDVVSMSMRERYMKNKKLFNAMAYLDPKRFNDINNKILDFSGKYT